MFSMPLKQLWRLSVVRQTLWLLGLFSLIFLLAGGGTYWLIYHEMTKAIDQRLIARMEVAGAALEAERPLPQPRNGQTIELTKDEWRAGFQYVDVEEEYGPDLRVFVQAFPQGNLVLGESVEREEELRNILAGGMQVVLLTVLIAALLASVLLANRNQKRLDRISDGLRRVAAGELQTEITLDGDDDLSLLAERINSTTKRLASAVEKMRVQSSNIAHDFRTPLAHLRAHVETNLKQLGENGRTISEADLEETLKQIDGIGEIFDALLRLAQIENKTSRADFVLIDLGTFVQEVADMYEPVVSDADQMLEVHLENPSSILSDRRLLIQLIANLIQNALSYGDDHQTIAIQAKGSTLTIADEGPGIPEAERERVLQPLYQTETTRQNEGYGLGLAMVRAICDLHGARLLLTDRADEHGLSVTITFPKLTNL